MVFFATLSAFLALGLVLSFLLGSKNINILGPFIVSLGLLLAGLLILGITPTGM